MLISKLFWSQIQTKDAMLRLMTARENKLNENGCNRCSFLSDDYPLSLLMRCDFEE